MKELIHGSKGVDFPVFIRQRLKELKSEQRDLAPRTQPPT